MCVTYSDSCNQCDTTICTTLYSYCDSTLSTKSRNELMKQVFPNPFKDNITLNWSGSKAKARFINQLGQVVYSTVIKPGTNELNVSELKPNAYILIIETDQGLQSIKLLKL